MQEVAKVISADTVVCNDAMMVHIVDTAITSTTVMYPFMALIAVAFPTRFAREPIVLLLLINHLFIW